MNYLRYFCFAVALSIAATISMAGISFGPVVSVTTKASTPNFPAQPTAPSINNITATTFDVSWTGGPTLSNNTATTFYLVQWSVSNQANFATVASNGVATTSVHFTGLTPSTTYFIRIVAGDGLP